MQLLRCCQENWQAAEKGFSKYSAAEIQYTTSAKHTRLTLGCAKGTRSNPHPLKFLLSSGGSENGSLCMIAQSAIFWAAAFNQLAAEGIDAVFFIFDVS